jgi:ATP-dependent protease ClpP protease subunit
MKKQGVFMQEIKAESVEVGIDIVGVIGWEVAFTELKAMFSMIPEAVKRVVFNIYSPGGDVWDGNGIVQAIGELGKTRETVARVQVAASMATLIAVACKERSIASNGRFLIHNAWTQTTGDAAEHEKRAKELRDCENEAAAFYAERTGKTSEEMLALMSEERWLTPEETKSFGFVQSIDNPFDQESVASIKAEIQAAGQWPVALVDIPKQEEVEKKEEEKHEDEKPEGSESQSEGVESKPDDADLAASEQAVKELSSRLEAEYKRGVEDGKTTWAAVGGTEANAKLDSQALAFGLKIKKLEALAAKLQGERDSLQARLSVVEKTSAEQVKSLTESLNAANARVRKFIDGAMTFSSAPETWEEALRDCSGDYVSAAKKYPDLKKAFNERKNNERK